MKKFLLLLISGLFAASLAVPVWAGAEGMEKMGKMEKMGQKLKLKGMHRMYGDVSNIDYAKGKLTVTNNEAEMVLHFPPASIKDLKTGDTITVELGFVEGTGIR